jgi:MFS family permease
MLITGRSMSCHPSHTALHQLKHSTTFYLKAVQGLGAGAITSSVQIVLSDLVTLRERGTFNGLIALWVTFLIACLGGY